MAWLHENDAVQQLSENVIMYDLALMCGTSALLSRIPENFSGVYAWYRRFEFDPKAKDEPEVFISSILNELCKDHCAVRETRLPPSHRITLQAETSFSKEQSFKELAYDQCFRQLILMLLENSLLFQQPLYIGKATHLHSRISSHLREGSILRERLMAAGHKIHRCRLLLIYTSPSISNLKPDIIDEENGFEHQVYEDEEFSDLASERLIEDILSRFFIPSFTLRYG